MRPTRTRVASVLLAVVAVGCGGAADSDGTPAGNGAGGASESTSRQAERPAGRPTPELATGGAPTAAAALLVNGGRGARITPGVPLIVAAAIRQSATAPERAPTADPAEPSVQDRDGEPVDTSFQFLGADADSLVPGAVLALRWELTTTLAPGDYTVVWDATGALSVATPAPRVRAASLRVLDQPTDVDELFFAELAVLQARGEIDELQRRVGARLAADPDDLLALRAQAEALEQAGAIAEARQAWLGLLDRLEARAASETPEGDAELAFWIDARLEALAAAER